MHSTDERAERMYPSEAEGSRSEFQRDRDRILYTEAFRRLSGVSQVAYTGETELYHDRLSHSLKVAQVGRRIAEYLSGDAEEKSVPLDPDVVETAALAHDIGHPPFGHPAESKLDQLLKSKNVTEGFEGNAQSLRVVSHVTVHPETETQRQRSLSQQSSKCESEDSEDDKGESDSEHNESSGDKHEGKVSADVKPRGLNLTKASINAILKYPWKRSAESNCYNEWDENESSKFGRYESEKEMFEWAREGYDTKHRCAEAEIMDWADDLVYAVHDVEDFYRAGVIPLEQILRERTTERDEFISDYLPDDGDPTKGKFEKRGEVEDWLNTISSLGVPDKKFTGEREDRMRLNDAASRLIERFVGGTNDNTRHIELRAEPDVGERHLSVDPELRKELSVLKFMLIKYVLEDPALQAQRRGEQKVIGELFEILHDAVDPGSDESVDIIHVSV